MKHTYLSLLITSLLIIGGCDSNSNNSNSSTNNTTSSSSTTLENNNTNVSTIIKSPNEDGGLEGNADNDKVKEKDETDLKEFLLKVADVEYFTYEVTSKVINNEAHFIQHFTPNAWYEENDIKEASFGMAQEKDSLNIFKYYLSDNNKEVIPSVYEYTGQGNGIEKLTNLYGTWTICNVSMLKDNMDEFSAKSLGLNKYALTDSNTASIFQFMTTYGQSIINYIVACYIEIINYDELQFKSTIDLGEYGSIESVFTPKNKTLVNFVNDLVNDGTLKGVDYHQDIYDFLNTKMTSNNYVLHGIKQRFNGVESSNIPYTIHCTNDYFYLEYEDSNYTNWGYILVPAYTPITFTKDGETINQTLEYSSCYKFKQTTNGSFVISDFIGPISTGQKYIEVNTLPETGDNNTLYIVDENGSKISYYYDNNEWKVYSKWYSSVGEFYINELGSTFYLSGGALSSIGSLFFEQSLNNSDEYFTSNGDILGALASGMFGWGFQQTATWMEYVERAFIKCNKDNQNSITSYDIGLDVKYFNNGSFAGIGQIYYTVDSFNQGNVATVENFIETLLGGGNNE